MRIVRTIETQDGAFALREHDGVFELVTAHAILLSSAALETERLFGELAARVTEPHAEIVIGGLGFGHTALGALAAHETARVTIVERLPVVVDLCTHEMRELSQNVIAHPRVRVVTGDVHAYLQSATNVSAILLDVDNGPEWATFRDNARLYAAAGLAQAKSALCNDGFLAVWSGYEKPKFQASLRAAGFVPEVVPLKERGVVRARAYVGWRR